MIPLINILSLFVPTLLFFLYQSCNREKGSFFYIKIVIFFLLLMSIYFIYSVRDINSGKDYYFYWDYYATSLGLGYADTAMERFEVGTKLLYYIGYDIFSYPPEVFFGLSGVLLWLPIIIVFKRINYVYFLMLLTFLLPVSFNLYRQSFAIVLFIVAIVFYLKSARLNYYIFVGLATLFHFSSIYLLFIPFFSKLVIDKKILFIIYIVSIIISVSGGIIKYLDYSFLVDYIPNKYSWYFINPEYSFGIQEDRVSSGVGRVVLILLTLLVIFEMDLFKKERNLYLWAFMFITCQIISNLFPLSEVIGRTLVYLAMFKYILVPYIFHNARTDKVKLICIGLMAFEILVFMKNAPIQGVLI